MERSFKIYQDWRASYKTLCVVCSHSCKNKIITTRPSQGLPWRFGGKESACSCRRHRFDPWSRKIPHASEQLSHTYWAVLWSPRCRASGNLTTELLWCSYWSPHAESLGSTTREAATQEGCPLQLENSPCSAQVEKCLHSNEDPAQSKKKTTHTTKNLGDIHEFNYSGYKNWGVSINGGFPYLYYLKFVLEMYFCIVNNDCKKTNNPTNELKHKSHLYVWNERCSRHIFSEKSKLPNTRYGII